MQLALLRAVIHPPGLRVLSSSVSPHPPKTIHVPVYDGLVAEYMHQDSVGRVCFLVPKEDAPTKRTLLSKRQIAAVMPDNRRRAAFPYPLATGINRVEIEIASKASSFTPNHWWQVARACKQELGVDPLQRQSAPGTEQDHDDTKASCGPCVVVVPEDFKWAARYKELPVDMPSTQANGSVEALVVIKPLTRYDRQEPPKESCCVIS